MKDIFDIINMQLLIWFLRPLKDFDWDNAFLDNSGDEKTSILTKTILNINYSQLFSIILNEIVTIDDRDPPWINNKIKSLIKNKT